MASDSTRRLERDERALESLIAGLSELSVRARAAREAIMAAFATRPLGGAPPCEVTIHVQDLDGIPVEGALVEISTRSEISDDEGNAAFDNLYPGGYTVRVSKEGYFTNTSSRALDCDGIYTVVLSDSIPCMLRLLGCLDVGIPGIPVKIYNLLGDEVASTTSGTGGNTSFRLPYPGVGNYRVVVETKRFEVFDGIVTLNCVFPGPAVRLVVAEPYQCTSCCAPYPQPPEWGIELPSLGTFTVADPEADCTWLGQTTVDVPGSTDLYQSLTENAAPASYNDCFGGGSPLSVLRYRIYCCEQTPPGGMCISQLNPQAYYYLGNTGDAFGQFGGFVLEEDMGILTINAPFRITIGHDIFGGSTLRVGTKTLRTWILSELPSAGWCRHELFAPNVAWLDPTVASYTLATGALMKGSPGSFYSDDCGVTGTTERAVTAMDYGDFAVMSGTREEVCYADEYTIEIPPFTSWPWGMTSIRVFDPNVFPPPAPLMMRMAVPEGEGEAPAAKAKPTPQWKRLQQLIHACPHLLPRDSETPGECGCLGRCAFGKGDLAEGRTSYLNCKNCVSANPPEAAS